MTKWAAMYVVYNDADYIEYSIRSLPETIQHIIVVRTLAPWNGADQSLDRTSEVVAALADERILLVEGRWSSEAAQRTKALDMVRQLGCDYCMIVDGDEIYDTAALGRALDVMVANPQVSVWRTTMCTYWKSPLWRIEPAEPFKPPVAFRVDDRLVFQELRQPSHRTAGLVEMGIRQLLGRPLPGVGETGFLLPDEPFLYHFSYAKPSEQIARKIKAFGHASEILPGWWDDVWVRWDSDHDLKDLHPTHPTAYHQAVYRPPTLLPAIMRSHPYVTTGVNGLTAE